MMSKKMNVNTKNSKKRLRVVLYLRLSKEDLYKLSPSEKSQSIKNQEIILRTYALENGWNIVGVFDDEDYSGSDRERPNFNKMINECKEGNVDIVLVKTQARFARDIELVNEYVHNKFRQWNVRFVTYIEKIDNTKDETKKTSQIIAMKDEWLLEDTSKNIRETLKSKRAKGQFTGSFAPYGYIKDRENKNHLLIDPIASLNIIRIFEEYNMGYGMDKIANRLSRDNILSPLEYKIFNGSKIKIPIKRKDYVNYINKAGTYVIDINYTNNQKKILKNITTIEVISNEVLFNNTFNIRLLKKKNSKIKIYYSIKDLNKLDIIIDNGKYLFKNKPNFNHDDCWKEFKLNDILPKDVTCIATYIMELDRMHNIFYSFEITLKENRDHLKYYYYIFAYTDYYNTHLNYHIKVRNKYNWSATTIRKILFDEVYIGNLVQFKTTTVSYKNHTLIYNNSDEQIRVENTHEAIINLKLWNAVQIKLSHNKRCCKDGKVHLLSNKVYCQCCQKIFYKCGKNIDGMGYLCCKDKLTSWSNCDNKKWINERVLHEYILQKFNILLDKYYSINKQIKYDNSFVENNLFQEKIKVLLKEKKEISFELDNKKGYFKTLYLDFKNGILNKKQYFYLKEEDEVEIKRLEQRLKIIERNLKSIYKEKNERKNRYLLFNKYKEINTLNSFIVDNFIDKIIIGKYDLITNSRNIKIIWNFL